MKREITQDQLFSHTLDAPSYYIQNVDSHGDPAALLLYNELRNRAWDILCSDKVIDYYKGTDHEIRSFQDLASGHCEDVACYAYRQLCKSDIDESRAAIYVLTNPDDAGVRSHHAWIELEGLDGACYNFDVDNWWGVSDYRHLTNLHKNPALGCVVGEAIEWNPMRHDPSQVWGIHGYEMDVFDKRSRQSSGGTQASE
jgi:hypothetical protein